MSSCSSAGKMKRKRKEACPSPILDDSPKRTKVQAQRKFAQNSGVHSPIITPIRDLDISEDARASSLSEPVELLPMKRPNTEDFLTFLCFRGTPILPSNLQFFNTASIVADGQVHEIKGDCPKNGPIDITKCAGSSSEKPFIAFGVRKRADPIVISRQMERKRRHALAIQALRRKYQEQKMAKIRALTISKLSEKTTNKTLVKTNTIQKTETVTKKSNTVEKTKVIATKHVKVTTQTLKTKVKPRMCLRSFRGKFVQKELPFRPKRPLPDKSTSSAQGPKNTEPSKKLIQNQPTKKVTEVSSKSRVTRSGSVTDSLLKSAPAKRQQIKRRILLPTSVMVNTIVKPKLRSTTMKKTVISRRKAQQRLRTRVTRKEPPKKSGESPSFPQENQNSAHEVSRRITRRDADLQTNKTQPQSKIKKEITKNFEMKREVKIAETATKKVVKKNLNLKRDFAMKTESKDVKKNVALHKTSDTILEKTESGQKVTQDIKTMEMTTVRKVLTRKSEEAKASPPTRRSASRQNAGESKKVLRNPIVKKKESFSEEAKNGGSKAVEKDVPKKSKEKVEDIVKSPTEEVPRRLTRDYSLKLSTEEAKTKPEKLKDSGDCKEKKSLCETILNPIENEVKSEENMVSSKTEILPSAVFIEAVKVAKQECVALIQVSEEVVTPIVQLESVNIQETNIESLPLPEKPTTKNETPPESPKKTKRSQLDNPKRKPPTEAPVTSSRPSRKTKEAAAIYMEILSHKLVNDRTIDDDNVSIDSFPELPNVKRTEQREIELKAQAKTCKEDEVKNSPIVTEVVVNQEELISKRKRGPTVPSSSESDNEVLQVKVQRKSSGKNTETVDDVVDRRQTRKGTSQVCKETDSNSSDESFHADVRVPRKKKNTRSHAKPAASVLETNVDIILEAARVLENKKPAKAVVDSDDESTTSDINLKSLQVKQRNKKLSKKKTSVKSGASFSDSDEEPLVKLTIKAETDQNPKKPPRKTADKVLANPASIMEPKPKRECTKRPSYYLPMMSSSEEDEKSLFHGFNTTKKEEVEKPKVFVQATLDLLSKDIGRKGKVNMSNEQIEQWLKDSALAGSSVAKENDAMLKFGEKIPMETFKTEATTSLLEKSGEILEKLDEPPPTCNKSPALIGKSQKAEVKSPLSDRKWIFKKDKKDSAPNKNAFSPENECSVYAFGEDNEDTVVSTPFRRPSRRPSSTATSRSEDETSKNEELSKLGHFRKPNRSDSEDCFNIPQNPAKSVKTGKGEGMVPPSAYHGKRQKSGTEKFLEPFDDTKYKVPSSPSASSGSSAKLYKKGPPKKKSWECASPVFVTDFPKPTEPAKYVEAPVFHPTEQEFQDPLEYIERIRHKAEQFGICKIVPPSGFKPECKVSDDMRFTAYNQYVHKMLHRWGPNFKEFVAIRKYLATQSIFLKTPPLIGGMEIDLPRLYQTVQCLGGLKEVIEKKKWSKVSEHMKIPKSAQDRVTKLDDIYCKYLLPYDTLSPAEREKLFEEVDTFWAKKESQQADQEVFDSDDNDIDECTIKGKSMALNAFYRIARNTMSMYFKVAEPSASEVEQEFWRYVTQKQNHICVHSASIDCGTWGYGFAVTKNSPFAKHPWNLKVLSNNGGSVLRSLGPVMGVTVPTLHVGMVFSACCWYRDPHGLPWAEYLHTGGNKIWYGIPSSSCEVFHDAMKKLVPNYCRAKELWLPSDTAMVPPEMLLENNVSLCRTIQEPGQFMVVFPKVYTSSISTGYVVSESVYFAPLYWLKTARNLFDDLKNSCEPSMFSLDKLFLSIGTDNRSSGEVLKAVLPFVEELCSKEQANRLKLKELKVPEEKIAPPSESSKKKIQSVDGDLECEICRTNLYVSMLVDVQEDLIYCLEDGIKLVEKEETKDRYKFRYNLSMEELSGFPSKVTSLIESKLQKKPTTGKSTAVLK